MGERGIEATYEQWLARIQAEVRIRMKVCHPWQKKEATGLSAHAISNMGHTGMLFEHGTCNMGHTHKQGDAQHEKVVIEARRINLILCVHVCH